MFEVRMEAAEQETIIAWTAADIKAGYFFFYTSRKKHYEKLLRRIGGAENLIECKLSTTPKGAFFGVSCKVPASYLSQGTFSIRSCSSLARKQNLNRSYRASAERLKAYQFRKEQEKQNKV